MLGITIVLYRCYISPNHSKNMVTLEAAILHCSETLMLAIIVTPKSFPFTILYRIIILPIA